MKIPIYGRRVVKLSSIAIASTFSCASGDLVQVENITPSVVVNSILLWAWAILVASVGVLGCLFDPYGHLTAADEEEFQQVHKETSSHAPKDHHSGWTQLT